MASAKTNRVSASERRGFRRPWLGPTTVFLIVVALGAIRLFFSAGDAEPEALAEGEYAVGYVIDGDTLALANGARVRLQGINTPEVARDGRLAEPLADEATTFALAFVNESGRRVTLTFGAERQDHYGRHLAFVWRGEMMLNEELVRAGLAHARPDYRFSGRMKRRLLAAQDEARNAGRGLWADGGPLAEPTPPQPTHALLPPPDR